MEKHPFYNFDNYPHFVCMDGNWGIWASGNGHLAAIPTPRAARIGCLASHFGDMRYLRAMPWYRATTGNN